MSSHPLTAPSVPVPTNLLDCDRAAMEAFFASMGEKAFRATQVMKWIYHHGVFDFAAMTDLSKALRQRLGEAAQITLPEVVADRLSVDGTRKWVLRLADGNAIEVVFIPEDDRGTLCVSSQVGCPLDCGFCATATQGFNRNLTTAEIIAQVLIAHQLLGGGPGDERVITNVVLMGMGEPLLNFDNVLRATEIMMDDFGLGLSKRRVTLSTAGVVPALKRLNEVSEVSLAVSLHAVTDAVRDQIVPLNRKYPIAELLQACRDYVRGEGRRKVTVEYVMLDGVNDSTDDAKRLVRLLRGLPSKINLIPFNPFPGCEYRASSAAAIEAFRQVLYKADMTVITRKTRGGDIDAACGQLVGKVFNRRK